MSELTLMQPVRTSVNVNENGMILEDIIIYRHGFYWNKKLGTMLSTRWNNEHSRCYQDKDAVPCQ
jgi:hypothetical protein